VGSNPTFGTVGLTLPDRSEIRVFPGLIEPIAQASKFSYSLFRISSAGVTHVKPL
jgi:hypothetical protein